MIRIRNVFIIMFLALALITIFPVGNAWAGEYLDDGALQNASGGWSLPDLGSCKHDPTITNRPECRALRYPAYTDQASCEAAGYSWTSACNYPAATDQPSCLAAGGFWSNGVCALSLKDKNRNSATCAQAGGTWLSVCTSTWQFLGTYNPPLKTSTDQCVRCHNTTVQYNGVAERWVDTFLKTGHKGMGKKATVGLPWAGPDGVVYPTDSNYNPINWTTGKITVSGTERDLYWIYGDWLAPLPRSVYEAPPATGNVCKFPAYTDEVTCESNGGTWIGGVCEKPQFTTSSACTTAGGTWGSGPAGICSNPTLSGFTNCINGGGAWVQNAGISYSCGRCHMTGWTSDATLQATKEPERSFPGKSWQRNADATNGQVGLAGGVSGDTNTMSSWDAWGITCTRCHDAQYPAPTGGSSHHDNMTANVIGSTATGYCSLARYSTQANCETNGGTWYVPTTYSCSLNGYWTQADCVGNGGSWRLARERKGQMITALCMNCHRQETGGLPYDSTNPATALKVGPAHGTVAFVSHPAGNEFLNSPHGQFTGTFAEIPTATYGNGYGSYFQKDGVAPNVGNGCTGCHNIHQSLVPAAGQTEGIHEECTSCHAKEPKLMLHPFGGGTPYENMGTHPNESCVICHMPEMQHLFRINVDPAYSTFPAAAMTSTVNANTAPDGDYTSAVWVDMHHACGQCHGGGTNYVNSTGGITSGSKALTVVDGTVFSLGNKITVAGAGAYGGDLETYIASVSGNTVNLAAAASTTVSNAVVIQNPVKNNAAYFTNAELAGYAKGIHNDAPAVYFSYKLDGKNPMKVYFDASASSCSGSFANCDAFEWDWGDGTPAGTGAIANHTYSAGGEYMVTLTVREYGVSSGTLSRKVTVYTLDSPPTASSTFSFNADTWTATLIDTSTDDHGIAQVTVNWGDGTMLSVGVAGQTFIHNYLNAGSYTITHKAIDTIGQVAQELLSAAPAYFTITGTVFKSDGVTPLPTAKIQVKKSGLLIRTVYSAANGTFFIGTLKPGTYELHVTKYGYTFNVPAATITVGPSSAGNNIIALTPLQKGIIRQGVRSK